MIQVCVIIPCYNVEKYIDRCVNSVVNQTIGIEHIQVILVNDASSDGTLDKMMEWEQQYPDNVLIITYDRNIRQGGARNKGLQYADGQYILFLDADDFVELDMLENMYDKAVETQADIIKCKYIRDNGTGVALNVSERQDQYYQFEKEGDFYFGRFGEIGNNGDLVGAIGSLYKKNWIEKNGLLFPEKVCYEDNFWNEVGKLFLSSVYIIDLQYYHYWVNEESTIMKQNSMVILDKLKVEVMILEEYRKRGAFDLFVDYLFWGFISRAYAGLLFHIFLKFDYMPIDINILKEYVEACFPDFRDRLDIDVSGEAEENKILFEILLSEKQYSMEEQEELRKKYLFAAAKSKGIV